jgi:hypothetical protein
MRYPNHILLDVKKPSAVYSEEWTLFYQDNFLSLSWADLTTRLKLKLRLKRFCFKKFTVRLFKQRKKVLTWVLFESNQFSMSNNTWFLFDINFIRKEYMYTKLKYSRSPQQDIVSGGVAALFAGFIGFLISEKFGIELVDSGDFYTAFMYIVFLCFAIKPLARLLGRTENALAKNPRDYTFKKSRSLNFWVDFCTYIYTVFTLFSKFTVRQLVKCNHPLKYSLNKIIYAFWVNDYASVVYRNYKLIMRFLKNYPRTNFDYYAV